MTDFKAKMHQIRFRLGLRPRPRSTSLQRSPRPLAGFGGRFAAGEGVGLGKRLKFLLRPPLKKICNVERGEKREGEVEGRESEGPKLLLNQGPSEPCYATGNGGGWRPNSESCAGRLHQWLQSNNCQRHYGTRISLQDDDLPVAQPTLSKHWRRI